MKDLAEAVVADRIRAERDALTAQSMLNGLITVTCDHDGFRAAPRLFRRSLCIALRAILEQIEATLGDDAR